MSGIQTGDLIAGRYRIAEQLGAGGMAQVFRAEDLDLGRSVAIKVLSSRYARDPQFVDRFRREASAAAKLNHPNIVQVFDRGEAKGTYYIVMEYLPGPDLKDIIRRRGAIGPDETIEAGLQILSALAVAHRNHVIHRDIKPQNVIMAEDGLLKVTDFGIAQAGSDADLTEVGSVIGTAQYLSPEQAQGGEITGASDCYSVGIVLYEMLTGRVPFDGERPVAVAMKQVHEPPVPPTVFEPGTPPELEKVVLKAMAKRPADRYRSAEEFSAALMDVRNRLDGGAATAVMGGDGQATQMMGAVPPVTEATRVMPAAAATPPPRRTAEPPPPDEPPRRPVWPFLLAALAVLLLILGAFWWSSRGGGDEAAAQVAVPTGLVGSQADAARTRLTSAKLVPAEESKASPRIPQGEVISVAPTEGTMVDEGSTVTLTVSSGPTTTNVPDVVKLPQAEAVTKIRQANLKPVVRKEASEDVAKGVVISQDPLGAKEVSEGTEVTITVSTGKEAADVPSVVGMDVDTALSVLRDAGLEGSVQEVTSERNKGTVVRQDPSSGKLQKGGTVRLEVSSGPQLASVPTVVGNNVDSARSKLENAGWNVTTQSAASAEPAGTVIGQTPSAGSQVPAGSTITLTVSDGPAVEPTPTNNGVPPPAPPATTPGTDQGNGQGNGNAGVPAPAPGN